MIVRYHHTEEESHVPEEIRALLVTKHKYAPIIFEKDMKFEVDYVLGDRIGIERKEINDLVKSIQENKIPSQLKRIIDNDLQPVLLVEGLLPDFSYTQMSMESIYGFISKMGLSIAVVHTTGYEHTAHWILEMALALHKKEFGELRVPVIKTKADHPTLARLMSIPGIGEENAARLRDAYASELSFIWDCYRMVRSGKSKMLKIEGIGKVKAMQIAKEVTKRWEA